VITIHYSLSLAAVCFFIAMVALLFRTRPS
jgi:hypothetical protein